MAQSVSMLPLCNDYESLTNLSQVMITRHEGVCQQSTYGHSFPPGTAWFSSTRNLAGVV